MFALLLYLALHPAAFLFSEAAVPPTLESGCNNVRLVDVAVQLFLYVDFDGNFQQSYRLETNTLNNSDLAIINFTTSASGQGVCDKIYEHWCSFDNTTAIPNHDNTKKCRRRRSRSSINLSDRSVDIPAGDPDMDPWHGAVREVAPTIEQAEAGLAGGVAVVEGARTSICSRFKCDKKHVISIILGSATLFGTILGLVGLIQSNTNKAVVQAATDHRQDVCTSSEEYGKVCVSYSAKNSPIYNDEETIKRALDSCTEDCIKNPQSCQFSPHSKTQLNNCSSWWCPFPWCSSKCDVEEHTNNMCISNRPKGCTFNKALDCDVEDPE
ncbi:hypothetical protein CspHIS471_0600230 [Cutaneotrichosporon sp. HIS471]|nr:hypothetical protein CspHIS471_0600230 [Cutaneotrichosporon sp. HIS471]